MRYNFNLIAGDSDGGFYTISCSHKSIELVVAHEKLKSEGIDLLAECDDGCTLTPKFIQKLTERGINVQEYAEDGNIEETDNWFVLYLDLAKLVIPDLKYEFLDDNIWIEGKGLFN
jgi:hypothetical protein